MDRSDLPPPGGTEGRAGGEGEEGAERPYRARGGARLPDEEASPVPEPERGGFHLPWPRGLAVLVLLGALAWWLLT